MKHIAIFALCASLAVAAQFNHHNHAALHKRAIVTETDTVVVWDVVTKTVIGSSPAPSSPVGPPGGFYETIASSIPSSSTPSPTSSTSAQVVHAAAVAPQYKAAQPQPVAPPAKAPAAPAPAKAPAAPVPAAPQPAAAVPPPAYSPQSGGSSGGSAPANGPLFHGDITYYDATGLSTCGYELSNSKNTVAIALHKFNGLSNSGVNQPASPMCNKKINIYPNGPGGKAVEVTVVDGCSACGDNDLDLPTGFFDSIMPTQNGDAPSTVGRYSGIAWEWAS